MVQVVGGGTHSGFGTPSAPDIVMSMGALKSVETWEPDDLTIVVSAGARIRDVEEQLQTRNQSLVMLEHAGDSSIGGAISAGLSSLRRGRLYGTRERVLEATLVTGDGRIVRSGGRVVKNVTGYDLHRLAVGAFGSMGVLVSVCLKLWPTPPAAMTVTIDEPHLAPTRPLAVLEADGLTQVFLAGTEAEVEGQTARLGGPAVQGHDWPRDPTGLLTWSLRVPPALIGEAISRLPEGWSYLAVHGVGEIRCASSEHDADLRDWAESVGGRLVLTSGEVEDFDPWGEPPQGLALQKRLIEQFDPSRVINPGRLPGGI